MTLYWARRVCNYVVCKVIVSYMCWVVSVINLACYWCWAVYVCVVPYWIEKQYLFIGVFFFFFISLILFHNLVTFIFDTFFFLINVIILIYINRMHREILVEKNIVIWMSKSFAGCAIALKMKEVIEPKKCFLAKVVVRSTIGTAWEVGLNKEVRR